MPNRISSCDSSFKRFIEEKTEGKIEGTTKQGCGSKQLLKKKKS
jgi:hypothetical protein